MSIWYDLIDWLGGYPFEVASPEEIVDFMVLRGFMLRKIITVGGNHGCNEFIFSRI
jgi:2-polyprenyl-6-hydroxyphenyl methylase/3-demethylubiquinone-9 3-methyltransferase